VTRVVVELQPAHAGRPLVEAESLALRRELDAGGRRGEQLQPVAHEREILVHMPPEQGARLPMPREHGEEPGSVGDHLLVEPGAADRHRLVVQADQRMAPRLGGEQPLEQRQFVRAEVAADLALDGGVEHHDLPGADADAAHQRVSRTETARHQLAAVVVAGQPEPRQIQRLEALAQAQVRGLRTVVREITGREQQVGARTRAHQIQHVGKARIGVHAEQRAAALLLEVRVGQLRDAHHRTVLRQLDALCVQCVHRRSAQSPAASSAGASACPSARQCASHSPSRRLACHFSSRASPAGLGYS